MPKAQAQEPSKAAYRCEDRELLVGIYKRVFWNWAVPLIPRWVHPNLLTLLGSACVVLAAVAAAGAVAGTPYLYLVSAALLFMYLTFDNLDGPHARRTGRASPTGEFLDHGLDGIASGCLILTGLMVARISPTLMTVFAVVAAFAFVLCMWEQYHTGTLVIPAISATEGCTIIMGVCVANYLFAEPSWLHYEAGVFKPITGIVLFVVFGYVVALIPPISRGRQAGGRIDELAPVLAVLAGCGLFTAAGVDSVLVGALVTLVGADVTCRYILLRHGKVKGTPLATLQWLVLLPLVPAFFAPNAWTAEGWALLSTALALALFLRTMNTGIAAFRRPAPALVVAAESGRLAPAQSARLS